MKRTLQVELIGASEDLGTSVEGVSLRFFSAYAKRLREAYQRSAQAVLTGAVQDAGRLPARAAEVDIRLVSASAGSLALDLAAVDTSPQMKLHADTLATDALLQLVRGMKGAASDPESAATPRAYRALIGSVPPAVRQRYSLVEDGLVIDEVILTSAGFDRVPDPVLANIERVPATIKGLVFTPRPAVLLDVDGTSVRANATATLVTKAFGIREQEDLVATLVENASGFRLLAIAPATEPFPRRTPSIDETVARYEAILRELAK